MGTPKRRGLVVAGGLAWQGLLMFSAAGDASTPLIGVPLSLTALHRLTLCLRTAATGFGILLADPFISAAGAVLWQSRIPPDLHGRVFGLTRIVSLAALPCAPLPRPS